MRYGAARRYTISTSILEPGKRPDAMSDSVPVLTATTLKTYKTQRIHRPRNQLPPMNAHGVDSWDTL